MKRRKRVKKKKQRTKVREMERWKGQAPKHIPLETFEESNYIFLFSLLFMIDSHLSLIQGSVSITSLGSAVHPADIHGALALFLGRTRKERWTKGDTVNGVELAHNRKIRPVDTEESLRE